DFVRQLIFEQAISVVKIGRTVQDITKIYVLTYEEHIRPGVKLLFTMSSVASVGQVDKTQQLRAWEELKQWSEGANEGIGKLLRHESDKFLASITARELEIQSRFSENLPQPPKALMEAIDGATASHVNEVVQQLATVTADMADKEKMSRALGTAFLTHQVAQLEKEVFNSDKVTYNGRGGSGRGGSGNGGKRGRGGGRGGGGRGGRIQFPTDQQQQPQRQRFDSSTGRPVRGNTAVETKQIAERLIVDASVLIHALSQVREWSKDDRKEIIVVPLEALNTLDLLKKGSSQIAIRARQASRFLEDQVGVNPRILVQFDDGYIPWERFYSNTTPNPTSAIDNDSERTSSDERSSSDLPRSRLPGVLSTQGRRGGEPEPPEWLKRTICCAKFEAMQPQPAPTTVDAPSDTTPSLKAVIAICCIPGSEDRNQGGRFENRASGVLTKDWAFKVGLEVFDVAPEMKREHMRSGDNFVGDDVAASWNERSDSAPASPVTLVSRPMDHRRQFSVASGDSRPDSPRPWTKSSSGPNSGQRKGSFGQANPLRGGGRGGHSTHGSHLVEKPAMPIPLTKAGLLPAGKVIRLLARGEKLDP
ncbi:hypothetical protein FRB98_009270, partial [Tulasnella sp. 332]